MKQKRSVVSLCVLSSIAIALWYSNLSDNHSYRTSEDLDVKLIASGFHIPWGLTFVSDREMLITERPGRIARLNLNSAEVVEIKGAPPVITGDQAGLLDIAVSPNYDNDHWFYITYAKKLGEDSATALGRARFDGDQIIEFEELFVSSHVAKRRRQYGGRIAFDGSGHIFIGHGDRSDPMSAQNLQDHSGSILRLNLDGSIPEDNPFVGVENALPEIWSYGHRNPQGLFYDKARKQLWSNEHGPRGGDEINLVRRGKNYGWPIISYGKNYHNNQPAGRDGTEKEGMEQPIKYYVPSIAPSSLLVYWGNYYPELKGKILVGALAGSHLNVVTLDEEGRALEETRYLRKLGERVRNIVEGPNGKIYLTTDSGKILELVKKGSNN